nr:thiamine pyrophosphate-dependent enzyme [Solimonas terrae]
MVETRIFDKTALALQRCGRLEHYSACLGQEAIVAALALSLRADDLFVAAGREYSLQSLRDAGLLDVLRYWSDASAQQPAPASRALARAREIAAGATPDRASAIVLAPGDDGLADATELRPSLNMLEHHGLPLIFVVPRRLWRQPPAAEDTARLTSRTIAAGIVDELVDGNDAIAMHDSLQRHVTRARGGRGPVLIEVITWPLRDRPPHADAFEPPRSDAELRAAWDHCPIKRLKRYLESRQLWSVDDEEALLLDAGERAGIAASAWDDARRRA